MRELLAVVLATVALLCWRLPPERPPVPRAASVDEDTTPSREPGSLKFARSEPIIVSSGSSAEPHAALRSPALPPAAADLPSARDFAFDGAALAGAAPGDRIALAFPQFGGRYAFTVETVTVSPGGARRLAGAVRWDGRSWPGLFTVADGWSFGTLATPEGSWELTVRGGTARVVAAAELERRGFEQDWRVPAVP
ncbi:MAG: hypothetical protein V2J02_15510 [Pseudomonadales bacterium]|nr:hypothetical protein [Pseudomonadales bacterium]